MCKTIVVANQKGGVGKTTTAIALSHAFALAGKDVLLLDMDPQGNASDTLRLSEKRAEGSMFYCLNAFDTEARMESCIQQVVSPKNGPVPHLFAVQGDIQLATADMQFVSQGREFILRYQIEEIKQQYDCIIIDTPPTLGILAINSLAAADMAIIPISPDGYSVMGIEQLFNTIKSTRKYTNPNLQIGGILLTRYMPQTIISREMTRIAEDVAQKMGTHVYDTKIQQTVAVPESITVKTGLIEYAPDCTAAKDYMAFTKEIQKQIEKLERGEQLDGKAELQRNSSRDILHECR